MSDARGDEQLFVALLGSGRPEVSCEVCFQELDRYVELERARGDAEKAGPGMRRHLEGCHACREEHQSLHALLRSDLIAQFLAPLGHTLRFSPWPAN